MELLQPGLGLMIWNLIGFLIVLFVLGKFAWKPILKSLKERETGIADALATADRVKAEMAQLKSENEALLAKAREERATLLREAKDAGDKMIAEAKEKAKIEYNHIITGAQEAIELQKNAAIVDVKNLIGKMVIEVTEKVIRRELVSKKDHEEYILKLADDLTNTNNGGRRN
jgi:F-type H+-transporting ATPase subunit b